MQSPNTNYPETTFRDYVRVLFRQKWVLIVSFVTVMAVVIVGLQLKTPRYEASVKMLVTGEQQTGAMYYKDLVSMRNTEVGLTRSEIVKSIPVIKMAVDALKLYERPFDYEKTFASPLKSRLIDIRLQGLDIKPLKYRYEGFNEKISGLPQDVKEAVLYRRAIEDLRNSIEVEPIRDTNLFTIIATDYDPVMAATMANVVSRAYVIFDLRQQLVELELKYGSKHPIIRQIQDNITAIEGQLNGRPLQQEDALGPATVKIIEQAIPPLEPTGPSKMVILLIGMFMSGFLGIMLAYIFEYMDQTVKTPRELAELVNLPLLGSIPKKRLWQKVMLQETYKLFQRSDYVNSYQKLAAQIHLRAKKKNARSIIIAGPDLREGSSTIIANLGFYFAYHYQARTLVIDANFREPHQHKIFKVKRNPGLWDVLQGRYRLNEVTQVSCSHLWVLPAGSTNFNPANFLDSPKMKEFMDEAKEKFDMILVDTADLRRYKDAALMAGVVDGGIILVSESKTRRHVIDAALQPFTETNFNLLGAVLNKRRYVIPRLIYDRI